MGTTRDWSEWAKRYGAVSVLQAKPRSLRHAQGRLFDQASCDETASGSAQDDNFDFCSSLKLRLYRYTMMVGHSAAL
jgi:hypothetical protein